MNKPVYLGPSILKLSKKLMYELWYDYVKLNYSEKAKLCYMDTVSLYTWKHGIYKNIAKDVETRYDASNYELDRPLPKGEKKKVIALMKDQVGGNIMTKFVGLRAKTYSYLIDDVSEDKKAKGTKKCVVKKDWNFKIIRTV